MNNNVSTKTTYAEKRAEALREFRHLRKRLLSNNCTVKDIDRAYHLKKYYDL